jgi:hypothetical protein
MEDLRMSGDAFRWGPNRPEDARPIHGWDSPMPLDRRADVPFQTEDDPEGAAAWLAEQLEEIPAPPRSRSVPIPADRRTPQVPENQWVRADGLLDPPDPLDFRGGQGRNQVVDARMVLRFASGLEETYEFSSPEEIDFQAEVEQDYMDVSSFNGFRERIPGVRSLRRIVITIMSPRGWRRLPTRRWQ